MTELSDKINELLSEPSTSLYPNWGGNLGFVASTAHRGRPGGFGTSIYGNLPSGPIEWPTHGVTSTVGTARRAAVNAVARSGIFLPKVRIPGATHGALPPPAQSGSSTVSNPRPYYGPDGTIVSVAEQEAANNPPVDFGQPRPTWGELPKPELVEAPIEQERDMAIDWGAIALGGIGAIINGDAYTPPVPTFNPIGTFQPTGPGGFGGPGVSAPGTYINKHGQLCKRRRRRRRLLTPTDLSDLAALATIVGKGDALKLATVKAVRR